MSVDRWISSKLRNWSYIFSQVNGRDTMICQLGRKMNVVLVNKCSQVLIQVSRVLMREIRDDDERR